MSGVTGAMIGISVASSVASAAKQASAAKKAARTQAAAGEQALQAQQSGYNQAREDFNPYRQAGVDAMGRLTASAGQYTGGPPRSAEEQAQAVMGNRARLGAPPPPGDPSGMPPPQAGLQGPMPGQMPGQMPQQGQGGMGPMAGGLAQGAHSGPPGLGQPPAMSGAPVAPQGQPQAAPGGAGGMIQVRAPTGEIAMLPADKAQQAVARGAQIVSR